LKEDGIGLVSAKRAIFNHESRQSDRRKNKNAAVRALLTEIRLWLRFPVTGKFELGKPIRCVVCQDDDLS
jgi:hypothetical protein